ncbi:MAG TPA: MmgE/PrpD family protein [Xanthobacteraceae bacterium]|nr:MmgE/PrpD family protein [Xanthobacteraceae bacterium]
MLLDVLGRYAAQTRMETPASDVLHDAKRAVIDWFAAMLPGTSEPAAANLRAALAEEIGRGRAIVYGTLERAPTRVAALLNGTASHITEFDDIFRDGVYHPGSPTVAAALAAAQTQRVGGLDLLRGIIVGYEISTRIAAAMVPAHYRFWHTTGTVGTFGAAAAAATILRADPRQFAHAMATAATMAAGLQQGFRSDSMSKPLHAGHAAEAGVLAALAAVHGFTGALDIVEGEAGFGRAMGPDPDWNAAFADLGKVHNISRMTVKNHGCCGHTFAAIDGAKTLQARHGLASGDITRIEIATYGTALKVAGLRSVETPFQGKFSLPYVVATALVHGNARSDAFRSDRLRDAAAQELMQRIALAVDPELDACFPKQRAARVTIETRDGRRFTHLQHTRKGDPDDPLSDSELDEKFLELASPVLGQADAQRALAELHRLDMREDCDLLTPSRKPARHVA